MTMTNALVHLAAVLLQPSAASAFSLPLASRIGRTPSSEKSRLPKSKLHAATAPADSKARVNTEVPVTRISVCAGELCQCQGEQYEYTGGAADAAIEELQGMGLPFPVDDVGCLGACGMGTMMAIDFENGDSIMTDGLESTLVELGIQREETPPSPVPNVYEIATDPDVVVVEGVEAVDSVGEESPLSTFQAKSTSSDTAKKAETTKPRRMLVDVRDRMREEAADEEVQNPWMNMASYLAKKATGKMFGSE